MGPVALVSEVVNPAPFTETQMCPSAVPRYVYPPAILYDRTSALIRAEYCFSTAASTAMKLSAAGCQRLCCLRVQGAVGFDGLGAHGPGFEIGGFENFAGVSAGEEQTVRAEPDFLHRAGRGRGKHQLDGRTADAPPVGRLTESG